MSHVSDLIRKSHFRSSRHPETLPDTMSPLYVVGMLGLLMKISAPMCAPTEYTIYFERQECNYCVAVNTTICMGFCFSRDSNVKELVGPRFLILISPIQWHLVATAAPVTPTVTNVPTKPAALQGNAPNLSDICTPTLRRTVTSSHIGNSLLTRGLYLLH
ncbi:thyrotropin subunit beta [Pimephales promelas]|nr:thyrotropin subunit beta [Pimephales promelas]